MKLKINQEYRDIVPSQTDKEYEELKKSMLENGQYMPISYNEDYEILDGHHRFRVAQELGLEIRTEASPRKFQSKLHEKLYVIDINLQRRQLTDFIRGELSLMSKSISEDIARQKQHPNNPKKGQKGFQPVVSQTFDEPLRTDEELGKKARLSRGTIRKIETIKQSLPEDDEKIKDLRQGKLTINKVYQKIMRTQKEAEYNKQRQEQLASIPKEEIKHTICGDFTTTEISDQIEDDSVDLIFTDPPYAEASLPLYKSLGEFASKKLKQGGSLVAYAGHFLIDRIIENIKQYPDLEFWWIIGEFHGTEGGHTMMRKQNITVSWKPLVWFVKRGREPINIIRQKMFADSVKSNPPENEKLAHVWEQSLSTPDYIIKYLTDEQDFVVDPMCGSGTTLVSAIRLNRRCKGIDLEQKYLDESETRIGDSK